jgi:hypothetical protein
MEAGQVEVECVAISAMGTRFQKNEEQRYTRKWKCGYRLPPDFKGRIASLRRDYS